jgi:cell division protein FtsL
MSEKKVVSKRLTIGLGALCIILGVALIASVFYYSTALNAKDSDITDLNALLYTKNDEVANLSAQIDTRNNEISSLNSQISSLQSQNDALMAPNLVWSRFDVRIDQGFFMISGGICNTGTETAFDVRLHVVAYAVDGTKVIDSYREVGSLNGKQLVDVRGGLDIYYGGSILDNWTITPEWSNMT